MFDEMTSQNASNFVIFLEYEDLLHMHYLLPRFFHVSIFLSIEILLVGEKYRNIAGNEKQNYIIGFHFKHYVILPLIDEYYLMNYQLMNTMIIYTYLITPPSLN